jgi:hypothetical protein
MNPNTSSPAGRERPPGTPPDHLAALKAAVDDLAAQDLDGLPDAVRAGRVLALRRFGRRGLWLAPTLDGDLALQGLLDPEAGHTLLAALEPLARPPGQRRRCPQRGSAAR